MAAREGIKIIADAMRTRLAAELLTMELVPGDTRPKCAQIRDCFTNDVLDPDDYDALIVDLSDSQTPQATLGTQGGADSTIPILLVWATGTEDRAEARTRTANAMHAIIRVLNRYVEGTLLNSVRLYHLTDVGYTFAIEKDTGYLQGVVAVYAHMRDERVQ